MFLDDTPAYPAAFFGAVRAGFVPLLINTLTPPDLLQFYLSDSGACVAVADAEFCPRFDAEACKDTALHTLISVGGEACDHAVPNAIVAERWLPVPTHIVEQYKVYATDLGNVRAQSATTQTFYLTIISALIAVLTFKDAIRPIQDYFAAVSIVVFISILLVSERGSSRRSSLKTCLRLNLKSSGQSS